MEHGTLLPHPSRYGDASDSGHEGTHRSRGGLLGNYHAIHVRLSPCLAGSKSTPHSQILCQLGAYGRYVTFARMIRGVSGTTSSLVFLRVAYLFRFLGVQLHHDLCDITTNLVLSKSDNYVGGGYVSE